MGTAYQWWRRTDGGRVVETVRLSLVAVVTLGGAYLASVGDARAIGPLGWLLLVAAVLALVWRRRFPRTVLAVTLSAAATYYVLGYPLGPEPVPFVVALYHAVTAGKRIVAITAAALCVGVIELSEVLSGAALETDDLFPVVGWLIAIILLGEFSRARRDYLAAVEERALAAERTREAEAHRRVAEERLRIARELHDSVGHHITVVTMHAGAALLRRDTHPELAYEALATIKSVGQEALRDLRGTLGVLRRPEEGPLQPSPTLAELPELIRRTEAAGPAVRASVDGERRPLPTGVEVAAYRIVQEALTNVGRHAGADSVDVRVAYEPDQLVVEIDDDGRGPAAGTGSYPGGSGLVGMRERAAAVGGRLVAGPRPGGGFRVRAWLPVNGTA